MSTRNHLYTKLELASVFYRVVITTCDSLGNVFNAAYYTVVDKEAPVIEIDTPLNNSCINTSSITLEWSVSEEVVEQTIYINGEPVEIEPDTRSYTLVGLGDGVYTIALKAVDRAGNTGFEKIVFTVDTSAPWIMVKEVDLRRGDNLVAIESTISSDIVEAIAYITYPNGTTMSTKLSKDTLLLPRIPGEYTVLFKLVDQAGNTGSYKDRV